MRSVQQETTLRAEAWAKLDDQVDHMELAMGQHARHIHALQDSNVIRQSTSTPSVLIIIIIINMAYTPRI